MSDIVSLAPAEVTNPATQTVYDLAAFAQELAMGLRSLEDILSSHNISPETYEILKEHPTFQRLLDGMRKEWLSINNTADRVAIEAAFTFEQAIPHLYARMINAKEPLNHATEVAKVLAKAGGIGESKREGVIGEKFNITINLGADTQLKFQPNVAPTRPSPILDLSAEPELDEERT